MIAMHIAEKMLLKYISNFTDKDLSNAIEKRINIVKLILYYLPREIESIKNISTINIDEIQKLTTDQFLIWLRNHRPDLFNVIIASTKGREWVEYNINYFKKVFK